MTVSEMPMKIMSSITKGSPALPILRMKTAANAARNTRESERKSHAIIFNLTAFFMVKERSRPISAKIAHAKKIGLGEDHYELITI